MKIKNKFLICLTATVSLLIINILCFTIMTYIENNYDYSKVTEYKGIVIESFDGIDTNSMKIEIEDGRKFSIGTGGESPEPVGTEVSVYVNEKGHYALTEKGVAATDSPWIIFYFTSIFSIFGLFIIYAKYYGYRGFIFSIVLFYFIYIFGSAIFK